MTDKIAKGRSGRKIRVTPPGGRSLAVDRDKAARGCKYFQCLSPRWQEQNGTFKPDDLFCYGAWAIVLNVIEKAGYQPDIPKGKVGWHIVMLIDYLLPEDTPEGRRLSDLQQQLFPQFLSRDGSRYREAIAWAFKTGRLLHKLSGVDLVDLEYAVRTLGIHNLPAKTVQMLTQLPEFGDISKAPAGLWELWLQNPPQNACGKAVLEAIKDNISQVNTVPQIHGYARCADKVIGRGWGALRWYRIHMDGLLELKSINTGGWFPSDVAANESYIAACGVVRRDPKSTKFGLGVWDASTLNLVHKFSCSFGDRISLCGDSVAVAHPDSIAIYNIKSKLPEVEVSLPPESGGCADSLILGSSFLAVEIAKELVCLDRNTMEEILRLKDVCSYTLRDHVLYTASHNGIIRLWVRSRDTIHTLGSGLTISTALRHLFCEGAIVGGMVCTTREDGECGKEIAVWNLATGKFLASVCPPDIVRMHSVLCLPCGLLVSYTTATDHWRTAFYGNRAMQKEGKVV